MKSVKTLQGYTIRLEKGEQIIQTLSKFCNEENVHSAMLMGIGAVENAELGFYHLDRKDYSWQNFEKAMEVVSLTGNVTQVENEPFLHIHAVLSDENFMAIGGHLKEGTVNATLEIFMQTLSTPISRTLDEEIGLKLLHLEDY